MEPIDFGEIKEAFDGIRRLSARGAALSLAAYVDDATRSLLQHYFVDKKKLTKKLLEDTGALSTFSARIDTAYAVGLLAESERRNLHRVRKIRNEFAHSVDLALSFDTPGIRNLCLLLEVPESTSLAEGITSADPQGRFVIAGSLLLMGLILRREQTQRRVVPTALTAKEIEAASTGGHRPTGV